jgi:biotin synthase-like enzyme
MVTSMKWVKKDLSIKFPGCNVINVNNDTNLECFPVIKTDIFWNERKEQNENVKSNYIRNSLPVMLDSVCSG